jgi:ABC-type Fe3+/spermidine/putrescine transport system ATPase subunit
MPKIEIKNLTKKYISGKQEVIALNKVNLQIESGKYHTLLGPSGCGKTTLLRTIAGLQEATSGKILFDGKDVSGLPPQDRDIGFVFQQFAVFPHFDVWHNTAYGPTIKGWPEAEIKESVEKNLKLVGLYGRGDALPSELSGGMKQRLGLARALATKSKLLFLDEPLSALDAKIGEFLRYELREIVKQNDITAIHVTHNQEEAMTISDNIILMKKGRVIQTGSPEELYDNPQSIFCANFLGKCNFFAGDKIADNVIAHKEHKIKFKGGVESARVIVGVRPEKIRMSVIDNGEMLHGRIEVINFLGYLYEYIIDHEGQKVKAYKRIKEHQIKGKYKVGDNIFFWFNPDDTFAWPEPKNFEEELKLE